MTAPLPRRIAWFAPWTWKRRWKVLMLTLPIASYPLSIGPAVWLMAEGYISLSVYQSAYLPIRWLSYRSQAVVTILDWYIGLFVSFN
jgi:hypothetical protein